MPFRGQRDIDFALSLATRVALRELREFPSIPKIYDSGIYWERDWSKKACPAPDVDGACERFLSPKQLLKEGKGDCDDVVPWRTAEIIYTIEKALQRKGMSRAKARRKAWGAAEAYSIPSPGIGYHILLRRADGKIEDPSKRLGMGKKNAKRWVQRQMRRRR